MKNILFVLLLLPAVVIGQKSEVFESSKNKSQLYSYSLEWAAKKWKSANDVIQVKDPEGGIVIVKGGLTAVPVTLGVPADGITLTTLTIRVKDNKAKIEFDNTNFKWGSGGSWFAEEEPRSGKKQWNKWREEVLSEINRMIADYKKGINKDDDF